MRKKGIKIVAICVAVLLWLFFILYIIGVLVEKGVLGQEKDESEITVKYKYDPKREMSREEDIPDSKYQDTLQKALEEGRTDLKWLVNLLMRFSPFRSKSKNCLTWKLASTKIPKKPGTSCS